MTNASRFFIYTMLVAILVMSAGKLEPAAAADLYDGGHAPPAASDDPRYRDIYGHPPPRTATTERYYEERYEERSYQVRDHAVKDRRPCLPPHQIKRFLYKDGWRDVGRLDYDVRQIYVDAVDADTGREFELTLDSCSGRVLQAEPDYRWPARRYGYWD